MNILPFPGLGSKLRLLRPIDDRQYPRWSLQRGRPRLMREGSRAQTRSIDQCRQCRRRYMEGHHRIDIRVSDFQSTLCDRQSGSRGRLEGAKLTKCHSDQAHDALEGHRWFVIMVLAIAVGSQAVFLIVVWMTRHSLVGMDLLDMLHGSLRRR